MGRSTMADDTFEFTFLISFNQNVPEWAFEKVGLYRGVITAEAVELLAGPASPHRTLREAFEDIEGAAKNIAGEKVKRAAGVITEPVLVEANDVL